MNEREIAIITRYLGKPSDSFIYNDDILLGYLIALDRLSNAIKDVEPSFDSKLFFASISHSIHGKGE